MQETDATTIVSFLSSTARVAACLILSISSFIRASFSMYVSVDGMYASGW